MLKTRSYSTKYQYLISIFLILLLSIICYFSVGFIGYRAVALILLMVVSLNAILFDIFPVMLSALLSALIWNFFFIPPILTLHIGTPEDGLMFLMYFVIASINGVLTFKIREFERKERAEEEKTKTIKLYNTLLNSLSHELRTPIATIIGAIDTMNDVQTNLSEMNRSALFLEIEIASFRLNRHVENLLNMSRLEAGVIHPKLDWCDVNELIFQTIKEVVGDKQGQKIVFVPDDQFPLIKLDRGLVQQVMNNIIHNSLQYTPLESMIKIEVAKTETECVLIVSDNGQGFPENEIDLVFNKFYRLNNSVVGGTGLGLSIVEGFVEAMGGKVTLENLSKGGARFTIKIPCDFSYNSDLENE